MIEGQVVIEGDGVQAEVGASAALLGLALGLAAHHLVDNGRAEGQRGVAGVAASLGRPDVGGVVGPDGRGHGAGVEQALVQRQHFVGAGAHQHDVEQPLPHVVANQLPILVQRAKPAFLSVMFRTAARRRDAKRHVGVLGVGQNEVLARRVGKDAGDLLVQ